MAVCLEVTKFTVKVQEFSFADSFAALLQFRFFSVIYSLLYINSLITRTIFFNAFFLLFTKYKPLFPDNLALLDFLITSVLTLNTRK